MKTIIKAILCILVVAVSASATNYTVKAGGGGSYTTISACAAVANGGDTCTVFAGSYSGWTQTKSGSSGLPITFTVNPGDTVTITSTVTVTNTSYVTIGAPDSGGGCANNARTTGGGGANPSFGVGGCFIFQNSGINGPGCGSGNTTNTIHITYNISQGSSGNPNPSPFVNFGQAGVPSGCPYNAATTNNNDYIGHNYLAWNKFTKTNNFCNTQIMLYGNNNLFEYNEAEGTGAQHFREGGNYNVTRFNYVHDDDGNFTTGCGQSPEHIDFVFSEGGDIPSLSHSLVEKNVWKNCINDAGNCKFSFSRAFATMPPADISDTVTFRYNYMYNINTGYGGAGDNSDGLATVPNWHQYNNTIASENFQGYSGACGTYPSASGGTTAIFNNICYNTQTSGYSPFEPTNGTAHLGGNLLYNTTCTTTCNWNNIGGNYYTSESSYSRLANQNPMWANYPTDGTVQAGSRVLGATTNGGGVTLTTVSSGCGTTSLVVGDARFFQAGWGPTSNLPSYTSLPVGDVIRVGNSTYQVTAVNYTANTLTTATSLSCSTGDPVSLYELTDGTVVFPLSQSSPDVGAFPFSSSGTSPLSPPSGLAAVVN